MSSFLAPPIIENGVGITLRPYQEEARAEVHRAVERGIRRPLVGLPTGTGKCHRAGTLLLMHDGSLRKVEDLLVGDQLMGMDSTPRTILSLARGEEEMVEVRPVKGDSWFVNRSHVLTLARINEKGRDTYPSDRRGGEIVDVAISEWEAWAKWRKHIHKLVRVGAEFPKRDHPMLDPYLLGALLGDGGLTIDGRVLFTNIDHQVLTEVARALGRIGLNLVPTSEAITYRISGSQGRSRNEVTSQLREYGLLPVRCERRFIPDDCKLGSRETRLEVLAGLIDSDGSYRDGGFEFASKGRVLSDDVVFVARSLGLAAYVVQRPSGHHRVSISGDCSVVPCRIPRKQAPERAQKKDVLRTGFDVIPTGKVERYHGFTLDGDGRYLLGDFTVTHNTVLFSAIIRDRADRGPALILAHRDELLDQAADKYCQQEPGAWIGKIKAGQNQWNLPVVVASVQTLAREKRLHQIPPDFYSTVIVDECHHATKKNTYAGIIDYLGAELTLGVTATPERADGIALGGVWEEIVYHRGILEMIEQGYLSEIKGMAVKLRRFNAEELKVSRGDFQEGQAGRLMMEADAPAHAAEAYLEHAAGRKTIVFTPTIELSESMAEAFNLRGIPTEHLDGTTPRDERKAILRRFHSDETMVVTNCAVLTEGFDEPNVSCIIIARPTKSKVLYVQMIGRGIRTYPGKEDCLVLDLVGNSSRLDLVTVPRLFGIDEKDAKEGVAAAKMREVELAQQLIGETAATQIVAAPGELESQVVDLFGGKKPMHWLRLRDGRWTLSMGSGFIALEQSIDGTWSTRMYAADTRVTELGHRLDLGYAQGIGEDYVRVHGNPAMVDPDAGWRRAPASLQQRNKLRALRIPFGEEITKGAASDLISAASAAAQLERAS